MKRIDCVWNIFLSYLLLIFFILIAGSLSAQTKFCDEDICVVEFNAGWNESNGCEYLDKLTDCELKEFL